MRKRTVKRTEFLEMLSQYKDRCDFVKVITGVRRCGKSTLMMQYVQMLKEEGVDDDSIFVFNFELNDYDNITTYKELNSLLRETIVNDSKIYLFLDEVQKIDGWERSISGLLAEGNADIYITGSNAKILSRELATFLTGRYVSFELFPLSFSEYMEFHQGKDKTEIFDEYLRYGGFPNIYVGDGTHFYNTAMNDLRNSLIYQDVVSRGNIRKPVELEKIVQYMMFNIGNQISSLTISNALRIDYATVENYIRLLEQACIFYRADRFDIVSTSLKPTPKYYAVDQGLRNSSVKYADLDIGRSLENVVFIELLRRGYKVLAGSYKSKEVDFVCTSDDGDRIYIQVCNDFSKEDVRERELSVLSCIKGGFRKMILARGVMNHFTTDGIIVRDVMDWLLERRYGTLNIDPGIE